MTDPKRQSSEPLDLEALWPLARVLRAMTRAGDAELVERAADTIQSLQERCGELEAERGEHIGIIRDVRALLKTDDAIMAAEAAMKKIAALEGALKGSEEDPQLWRIEWLDALLQEIEAGNIGWLNGDEDPSATLDMLRECRELVTEGRQALAPGGDGGEGQETRGAPTDSVCRVCSGMGADTSGAPCTECEATGFEPHPTEPDRPEGECLIGPSCSCIFHSEMDLIIESDPACPIHGTPQDKEGE